MSEQQEFKSIRWAHKNSIYCGKWRASVYSVTVRYKEREVSISCGGARQEEIAKALLIELIDHDAKLRQRDRVA